MKHRLAPPLVVVMVACPAIAQPGWRAVRLHPDGHYSSVVYTVGPGVQGGTSQSGPTVNGEPVLWRGSSSAWTSFTSANGSYGIIMGSWRGIYVGGQDGHALLWEGSASRVHDLTPAGLMGAVGLRAIRGEIQAGVFNVPEQGLRAAMWRGTPESFVDLHPAGAWQSWAAATDGERQGGAVLGGFLAPANAAIWSGTPQSFVNLMPPGAVEGEVTGMAPGVQVGYVRYAGSNDRAAIWRGTAQSFVNFNGPLLFSQFFATTGRIHVGRGHLVPGGSRAVINLGRPDAWLGLYQSLPPEYQGFSAANAVYQDGPTIYVGGYAESAFTAQQHAFLWTGTDPCYANCDQSTTPPLLNALDFACFLTKYEQNDGYANCDQSTTPPELNALDFACFLNSFGQVPCATP